MAKLRLPGLGRPAPFNVGEDDSGFSQGPPGMMGGTRGPFWFGRIALIVVLLLFSYAVYEWFFVRVVVGPDEVLVLLKKYGDRSLESDERDQVVIPAPPPDKDAEAYRQWEEKYEDVNGILEQVHLAGTYFKFGPFDYEREVHKIVEVPAAKVGIVVRKFGQKLKPGQILAESKAGVKHRGPLPGVLQPGRYPEYSNPYAYEMKLVDPVQINPGHLGVVTIMAGPASKDPNQYLVEGGEQGVQRQTERPGFLYVNPYERRMTPISTLSQRFEMRGDDAIRFPSKDSFEIKLEGFVEWAVDPARLPLTYVQYAEGSGLIQFLEEQVILPNSRSFCRLVGSQFSAKEFIGGETKLKFQQQFQDLLRAEAKEQGVVVLQALVRDIVPPTEIKEPISEREVARQQIVTYEQQIQVAKSQAELARETEMATQNQKIGDANKEVVTLVKRAEQDKSVAETKAQQELEVAKLRLEAAQKQADAIIAKAKADANVILLNKQAEAEPLKRQVEAFGDGNAFAQYFFYQQVAPSIKSILTNTDGPFADLFKQFTNPPPKKPGGAEKVTEVQP